MRISLRHVLSQSLEPKQQVIHATPRGFCLMLDGVLMQRTWDALRMCRHYLFAQKHLKGYWWPRNGCIAVVPRPRRTGLMTLPTDAGADSRCDRHVARGPSSASACLGASSTVVAADARRLGHVAELPSSGDAGPGAGPANVLARFDSAVLVASIDVVDAQPRA